MEVLLRAPRCNRESSTCHATNGSHSNRLFSIWRCHIRNSKWGECGLYNHSLHMSVLLFDSDNRSYWS
jgi:hypothetical protein